ncbi:MAG: glycosyltransferase family 39 protein [Candidatus Dojkabacteria bacterium]
MNKRIKNIEKYLLIFTILLVLIKLIFYFYIFDIAHAPDYGHHHYILNIYKQFSWSISLFTKKILATICTSMPHRGRGLAITSPNLYGIIVGKTALLLDFFLRNEVLSIRLTNLLQTSFGLLNIYFVYKISGFIFKEKLPRIFTVLLLTNIQMFSYLINFLNYDNLANLASTMSIYFFLKYIKKEDIKDLFILIILICIGVLVKYTTAVLFVLLILLFFYLKRKHLVQFLEKTYFFVKDKKNIFISVITFLVLSITFFYYTKNYLTFNTILPSSPKGKQYCQGFIEKEEEINPFDEIESEDSIDTEEKELIGFLSFARNWLGLMVDRTINVASHKSLHKPPVFNTIFSSLLIISFCFFLIRRVENKDMKILVYLFLGYLIFLFFYKYHHYLSFPEKGQSSGIAGRYLFPVYAPFIILFVYSYWNLFKNRTVSVAILAALSIFFIYSDKVFLLRNYKTWSAAYRISTDETTGSLFIGQSSSKQRFKVQEEFSNRELGVYISTYGRNIRKGITFNLYEGDCFTNIESIEMRNIRDNQYKIIKFTSELEYNKYYCFDIQNEGSDKPVTLWYSSEDLEGYSSTILLEEKDGADYTVGPLNREESSPKQVFYINEGYSNNEIAVFASTYERSITEGFQFNLYDESCLNKIEVVDIDRIWDNDYFFIELKNTLEHEKHYCFDIENIGSDEPITLWYSSINLNGNLFEDEDKDIHYSQVKEVEEERDLLYSPILKYGF